MELHIPDDLADALRRRAAACGSDPEKLAVQAIRQILHSEVELEQQLRPVREAFLASGKTEEEAVQLFEEEKHALRREHKTDAS